MCTGVTNVPALPRPAPVLHADTVKTCSRPLRGSLSSPPARHHLTAVFMNSLPEEALCCVAVFKVCIPLRA